VLGRLVDQGNSVLVIEHNLDVIKTSDWLIDMGPEGGSRGGMVIAEGTPEDVAASPASYTGQFLKPLLGRPRGGAAKPVRRARKAPAAKAPAKKAAKPGESGPRRRRRPASPPEGLLWVCCECGPRTLDSGVGRSRSVRLPA
jgi:excinuclease ABC subunit A